MRQIVLAVVAAGCVDDVAARWELDHDHVVAARAEPPGIMPGETATLDALVAHADAAATIEQPVRATAPGAPAELGEMVAQRDGVWTVVAPSSAAPAGPVAIDIVMTFARGPQVKKTVWLGTRAANPAPPALTVGGAPVDDAATLPRDADVYVTAAAGDGARVNWLTSCGTLFQDDVATAFVRATEPCEGELAAIVRAPDGGVSWRVIALRAE
jgi:hypothetical protein